MVNGYEVKGRKHVLVACAGVAVKKIRLGMPEIRLVVLH